MNKIYTFSTKEYTPISFNDFYLYENYGLIVQLLKANKISDADIGRFCKPEIQAGQQVDWYANKIGEFKSLDKFDSQVQSSIIAEFDEWKIRMQVFSKKLKNNGTSESKEWFQIMEAILHKDNLIVLSNGADWSLVWGWLFNKFNSYYSRPDFERYQTTPELIQEELPAQSIGEVNLRLHEESGLENSKMEQEEISAPSQHYPRYSMPWWLRLLKFLRWFTYRFWFFFVLIMLILLLLCLFRALNFYFCT